MRRTLTRAQLRKMKEGRARARKRRPARLKEVEARMDRVGTELGAATTTEQRWPLRREIRELGAERMRLKWGDR